MTRGIGKHDKTGVNNRPDENEQQTAYSTQDPAEGRRDIGGPSSPDTQTGRRSRGSAPQKRALSTDDPVEGERQSAKE